MFFEPHESASRGNEDSVKRKEPMMVTAAIPFVRTTPSQNPNLRGNGDPSESYMRAMTVAFASVSRWNPNMDLVLVTNDSPAPHHQVWLDRLKVDVILAAFEHRPPVGFMNQFEGCLFLLDALPALRQRDVLYIDPDVLCVASLDALIELTADSAAGLILDFPPDEDINGLSRREAASIHHELGRPEGIPDHIGGEAYFIPHRLSDSIIKDSDLAWRHALERHKEGRSGFKTEEHILSYALRGVPLKPMNQHVRRVWTAHRYRTVSGDESSLSMWHLPAEKDRGFGILFEAAQDQHSWFWHSSHDEFIDRSSRAMGLRHRSGRRLLLDLMGAAMNAVDLKTRRH